MEQYAVAGAVIVGGLLALAVILLLVSWAMRRREQGKALDPDSVEAMRLAQKEGEALEAENTEFRYWDGAGPEGKDRPKP